MSAPPTGNRGDRRPIWSGVIIMVIGVGIGIAGGMGAAHSDSRGASEAIVIIGSAVLIIGLFMAVIAVVDYARA